MGGVRGPRVVFKQLDDERQKEKKVPPPPHPATGMREEKREEVYVDIL